MTETWYAAYRRKTEYRWALDIVINKSTLLWGVPPELRRSFIRPLARRVMRGEIVAREAAAQLRAARTRR
jgi:hypothetical protein